MTYIYEHGTGPIATEPYHVVATYKWKGGELECLFDYEPEEGDGWNEPHRYKSLTLVEAWANGLEIAEMLDSNMVYVIEQYCLEHRE